MPTFRKNLLFFYHIHEGNGLVRNDSNYATSKPDEYSSL
jgi:hypothetical protein